MRWKLVLKLEQPSGSSLPFAPGPYISLLNFITIKMGKAGDNWGSGCQVLIAATSCAGLLWNCRDQHCNGLYFPDYRFVVHWKALSCKCQWTIWLLRVFYFLLIIECLLLMLITFLGIKNETASFSYAVLVEKVVYLA